MTATSERPTTRQPAWWLLVLVAFGATIVWAVRFGLSYLLVPVACTSGDIVLHLVSVVSLLAGAAVTAVNLLWLRRPLGTQARFALLFGAVLNVFFVGVTFLEATTVFFIDACAKGAIP